MKGNRFHKMMSSILGSTLTENLPDANMSLENGKE
jgi:hypothetical protein